MQEERVRFGATTRKSYIEKLEKIRSNYSTKKGKPFTFSGVISLILRYGFSRFEEKHKVKIDDLKLNNERLED